MDWCSWTIAVWRLASVVPYACASIIVLLLSTGFKCEILLSEKMEIHVMLLQPYFWLSILLACLKDLAVNIPSGVTQVHFFCEVQCWTERWDCKSPLGTWESRICATWMQYAPLISCVNLKSFLSRFSGSYSSFSLLGYCFATVQIYLCQQLGSG